MSSGTKSGASSTAGSPSKARERSGSVDSRSISKTYTSYTQYAHNSEYPQAWNLAYSYICALNSPYFETEGCNFSIKNMSNKGEGLSKDGTGRV